MPLPQAPPGPAYCPQEEASQRPTPTRRRLRTLTQKAPFFHRWPFRVRYRRPAENPPNTLWEMAGIHTKGPVSWSTGGLCQPLEPAQTHLPHEHEEEAGRGHESSPAGGREHPKHGDNWRREGGECHRGSWPGPQPPSQAGQQPWAARRDEVPSPSQPQTPT